ncbi:MAG: hypothetical protein NVV60_05730 [Luteimonas sp.]|nr:hypothetical protein [Luteimonas sp.]
MTLQRIRDSSYSLAAANDDNLAVVAKVEQITSAIPALFNRLRPAISAMRSGMLTKHPNEVYFYLLGALHASNVGEDEFDQLLDVLDYLRPNEGVEEFTLELLM